MSAFSQDRIAASILPGFLPAAGIGLRSPHVQRLIAERPKIGWLEIHSENYLLSPDTPRMRDLLSLRRDYPLSCHGVGLSLASAELPDSAHLRALLALVERVEPMLVSEHLAWSRQGAVYYNDLLPVPYTDESLSILASNIDATQNFLGRRILVENPARYVAFAETHWPEGAFMAELVRRTGCGLLLDVNNLVVGAANLKLDAGLELASYPLAAIGEIHIAGHAIAHHGGEAVLLDDHGAPPCAEAWRMLTRAYDLVGARPTLIEWDTNIPALEELLGIAARAQAILDAISPVAAMTDLIADVA
jgi:uncharacterized protein